MPALAWLARARVEHLVGHVEAVGESRSGRRGARRAGRRSRRLSRGRARSLRVASRPWRGVAAARVRRAPRWSGSSSRSPSGVEAGSEPLGLLIGDQRRHRLQQPAVTVGSVVASAAAGVARTDRLAQVVGRGGRGLPGGAAARSAGGAGLTARGFFARRAAGAGVSGAQQSDAVFTEPWSGGVSSAMRSAPAVRRGGRSSRPMATTLGVDDSGVAQLLEMVRERGLARCRTAAQLHTQTLPACLRNTSTSCSRTGSPSAFATFARRSGLCTLDVGINDRLATRAHRPGAWSLESAPDRQASIYKYRLK